jgi:nucleoside phosphorylase/CheY-like chemotaxis protein
MKHKLLIIDDRPDNRSGIYKSVLSNHFELIIVEKASELDNAINNNFVDGYLVDIVLSSWLDEYKEPLQVIKVLKKIKSSFEKGKEKPIFLVSNEYENLIKDEKLTSLINHTIDEEININTFFTYGEFLEVSGSKNKDSLRPIPSTILWHIKKAIANIDQKEEAEIDYAIITALYYTEMEEVLRAFSIDINSKKTFGKYFGYKFKYGSKNIILMSQQKMGMVDSAILSSEIMLRYNPKFLFMPGVCAGSDKTNFGDIIIAKKVQLFQTGKLKEESFELESTSVDVDSHSITAIQAVGKIIMKEIQDELSEEIQLEMIEEFQEQFAQRPKLKSQVLETFREFKKRKNLKPLDEPTACSTFVLDKKGYFEKIRETFDRKTIGLEMEGYGLARASDLINNRTKAIMIKAVMDKTNEKSDFYKGFAAYVSAQFVKKLIDKNVLG